MPKYEEKHMFHRSEDGLNCTVVKAWNLLKKPKYRLEELILTELVNIRRPNLESSE